MPRKFAEGTEVSPEKSKAEIETLLTRYGADQFMSGWDQESGTTVIQFRCKGKYIRFKLAMPTLKDEKWWTPTKQEWSGVTSREAFGKTQRWRTQETAARALDQELRRLWRSLALVIKAKLEAVAANITSFETEFMAHIVMPDGKTVGEHVMPKVDQAYKLGKMQNLLPAFTGDRE